VNVYKLLKIKRVIKMKSMNEKEIMNYKHFMDELQVLTKKYGIAIQACDCFIHFDLNNEKDKETLKRFEYDIDLSSGDLMNNLDGFEKNNSSADNIDNDKQ
jgi:hypothetical protein